VADFETKLERLSLRGTPVGAEELIERIEAELAGDPLVVVTKQREGVPMTKTDQRVTTKGPGTGRGLVWAAAAFVAILTVGGLFIAFSGDDSEVVDPATVPTTAPETQTMTDLEIVEAGVAALYSGDAETAAELFELESHTDDQIRELAAYQAAIDGRLDLLCTEGSTAGTFNCTIPYHNAMTDALGTVDRGDTIQVVVSDGQIRQFAFPVHSWMILSMATFLSLEGRFDAYESCVEGAYSESIPASCASVEVENLDSWAEWYEGLDGPAVVENAIGAWFGGDCVTALIMSVDDPASCSDSSSSAALTVEYESMLDAQVLLENCVGGSSDTAIVRCDVHYSNAMNEAVGKAPAVTAVTFEVSGLAFVMEWYDLAYPKDTELSESFQAYAEGGELGADYAAAECATALTPECATLILDNLDDWAVWHQANN
jgi:hypothetical protein